MLLELVKNYKVYHSNTTLVKVKLADKEAKWQAEYNSNTTLVKVKSMLRMALLGDGSEFKYNTC